MATKNERTPLPWRVSGDEGPDTIYLEGPGPEYRRITGPVQETPRRRADHEFLAAVVAAHGPMREALEAGIGRLENLSAALSLPLRAEMHVEALREQLPSVVADLRAALALVRKETP